MKFINRCVVTLEPKASFTGWVSGLGLALPDTWEFEGGAYLLDEHESEQSLMDDIRQQAQTILENEFSVWTENQDLWPWRQGGEPEQEPAFTTLKQLFTLHIAIAGFDLGKTSLLRADIPEPV